MNELREKIAAAIQQSPSNATFGDEADAILALPEFQELMRDAKRYRWILHQAKITDFIFKYLESPERHVSNAIDAAMLEE